MHGSHNKLFCSQGSLTLSYLESSKKVAQRSISNSSEIWIWRTLPPVKLQQDVGECSSYHIHKMLPPFDHNLL